MKAACEEGEAQAELEGEAECQHSPIVNQSTFIVSIKANE
jgi:hypothetical protein